MQPDANAQENRTLELVPPVRPAASWRVAEVEPLPGYRLHVRFNDGTSGIVDMAKFVTSDIAGVFAVLRDEELFRQVRINLGAVSWPGELDLAPDAMHRALQERETWTL